MPFLERLYQLSLAYRLRWKRRRLLARCWRKRRQLILESDKTKLGVKSEFKAFICAKNEITRLPWWLDYYRRLGVQHFYCVVNNSTDGTLEYLSEQPDCSVWSSQHSYKSARFGMDWVGWLLRKHGHGAWCLTVDADELLTFPHIDKAGLPQLTQWLDSSGKRAFGAQILDMYPKKALGHDIYISGANPTDILTHYDAWNTTHILQPKHLNQWIQGGVRARVFFQDRPQRAPTLNKIPLVKWHRSYAYVTSTHIMLPRALNNVFDATQGVPLIGCLLHTKFLDSIVKLSADHKHRSEHFENSSLYEDYYDQLTKGPVLWCDASCEYRGWRGLIEDGILWRSKWGNNV